MVLKASQERVTTLLKDTITLLCKNGLEFKNKFSVEALIGVTLDDNDVFLISMNELVQSDNPVATENDDNESNPDSTDTRKSPKSPRHRRHKRRHSGESRQSDTEATSSLPVARVKTEPGLTSQDNEAPPGPGGNQNPKPENVWNQNEFQPLSLTPVDDSSLHSLTNMTTNEEPRTKMLKFENSRTGDDDEEEVEGDEEDEDDDDLVFIKQEATDTPGSSCSQQSFTGNPLGSPSFQNQNYSFSDASMLSQDSTMAGSMMSPQQYKQYPRGRPRVSTATNLQPQSQQQQNMGDGSQQQGIRYRCTKCEKSYLSKTALQRHLNQHEGKFSYYCPFCNKGFNANNILQGHISWHTGVKEFVCPVCNKDFRYKHGLKEHLLIQHRDIDHEMKSN